MGSVTIHRVVTQTVEGVPPKRWSRVFREFLLAKSWHAEPNNGKKNEQADERVRHHVVLSQEHDCGIQVDRGTKTLEDRHRCR